jgi:tetratricopeptide (TPR) repeat protein
LLLKATTFKFILLAAGMSVVASNGIAQTTARDYCNRGIARQKKGDLDGALADYNRAIKLDPHDATAYDNRGLAKMAKGDLDGALADYDRAVQISPRNFKIRASRGLVRQRKGDLDGALADYDMAIKFYRNYQFAYSARASVKIAKHDLDGALADCNRAIELNPKDAAAYDNRALIETAKGNRDAAAADFNRAIKLDPKYARNRPPAANKQKVESTGKPDENRAIESTAKNLETGKNRDVAAQKENDVNSAQPKPDHTPPIEIEPENIAAAHEGDVVKRKNDDHNGAAVDHKPAITSPPKTIGVRDDGNIGKKTGLSVAPSESGPTVDVPSENVEPSTKLEPGKQTAGDLGGGVAEARGAGALNNLTLPNDTNVSKQNDHPAGASEDQRRLAKPTVPNIPNEASLAKQSKADLNVAPADHSRAAEPNNLSPPESPSERQPTTAVGYTNRAQFRKSIGDLAGALADYNRAIELNPKYATAYNGRGNIKKAKHDLDGAVADYSRAIELNGGNAIAYYNRGVTKQAKGDMDGALADFNPAIQLDPKNASAYYSRGLAKAMKDDFDGALADYNRATELNPKDAATYNSRGDLFFSVHNWHAALENYNRFFELSKEGQEYPRLYVWLTLSSTGQTDAANKELIDYLQQRGNTPDWFSSVASYLLGRISAADLLAAAKSSDKKKENGQLCEAWFYTGMKKLIGGDKTGARDCFNKSLATNEKDYTEYHFARAELKALRN